MKDFTKQYPVTSFLINTFILTWVVGLISVIILTIVERALNLENNSISNTFAKYGPTLGGLVTVYFYSGKTGFKNLLLKGVKWKVGITPYLFAIFGPPIIIILALDISGNLSKINHFPSQALLSIIPIFFAKLFLGGGYGEEFGWRGFMLPQLNKRYNHLISSFIVGIFWVIWHLPAYVIGNKGIEDPLLPFTIQVIAFSYIFTWLYYRSKESVLIVAITHAMANASLTIIENLYSETSWYKEFYSDYYWGITFISVIIAIIIIASNFIFKKQEMRINPQS